MGSMVLPSRFPLVQAPMAGVQGPAMTIAASNAGALGSLPAAMLAVDTLAEHLTEVKAGTAEPFNVNFFAHTMPTLTEEDTARWRGRLAPYFERFGVSSEDIAPGVLRRPFGEEQLEVLLGFDVPVVSFHFGLPDDRLLEPLRARGTLIMSSATTLAEGLYLQGRGVDVVIAQGVEAGGHRGVFLGVDGRRAMVEAAATQVGTFALASQLVRELSVPVVVAGGVATAEDVRGAMALGAAGVQVGTSFMLCDESAVSDRHRVALREAATGEAGAVTALTNIYSGRPARSLVTGPMRELGFVCEDAAPFPYAGTEMAALNKAAAAQGETGFASLWCGQNPRGMREVPTAQMVANLAQGFIA